MENVQDVNNMKMWVFRLAQTKWNKSSGQCARFFAKNGIFSIISDCYDYLHLMSYKSVVTEIEEILESRGVKIYDQA